MPYVTTSQGRLFYLRRTAAQPGAPPLLLIHGAGGQGRLWGGTFPYLRGAEVIAPDLPGHGHSPGPGLRSIEECSAAILELMDALELPAAALGGHSMGGAIALEAALRAPGRVRGLALLSVTARLFVAPSLLEQLLRDVDAARRWIVENGYGAATPQSVRALGLQQLAEVAPDVLHGDFIACSTFDRRSRLDAVRCPALVLCGAEDRLTPLKYVRALQEALPASRLEVLPGAGHMLPMECPQAVGQAVAQFLAGLGPGAPA